MSKRVKTQRPEYFIKRIYASIPGYITGDISDTHGIGTRFWSILAHELYTRMHNSFLVRSEGGTDDLGNSFKPLAKSTIASRPIGAKQLREFGLTRKQSGVSFKNRRRGLLSPREDAEWRKVYSKVLAHLMVKISYGKAQEIAAKIAWTHVKRMGARTKKDVLGHRDVLIMRVTDSIYNSLEPSKSRFPYRARKNQLFEVVKGKLTLGTTVQHAKYHNKTRPVIPDNIDPWISQSIEIAFNEIFQHIERKVL